MTRSLSRQASQNLAEVKEEIDSDSDYTPEPVPKKSRGSAAPRMRSTAGRKPNSAKGDGLEHLPPDERDKVRMRRQKNKEAAARYSNIFISNTVTLKYIHAMHVCTWLIH